MHNRARTVINVSILILPVLFFSSCEKNNTDQPDIPGGGNSENGGSSSVQSISDFMQHSPALPCIEISDFKIGEIHADCETLTQNSNISKGYSISFEKQKERDAAGNNVFNVYLSGHNPENIEYSIDGVSCNLGTISFSGSGNSGKNDFFPFAPSILYFEQPADQQELLEHEVYLSDISVENIDGSWREYNPVEKKYIDTSWISEESFSFDNSPLKSIKNPVRNKVYQNGAVHYVDYMLFRFQYSGSDSDFRFQPFLESPLVDIKLTDGQLGFYRQSDIENMAAAKPLLSKVYVLPITDTYMTCMYFEYKDNRISKSISYTFRKVSE